MSFLYVIRHAQVKIDPAKPPAEWSLSPGGWAQTDQMAQRVSWEDIQCIYHSPEKKAVETAQAIAAPRGLIMRAEPDLRELAADVGFMAHDAFAKRVGAHLEGKEDPAFEPFEAAAKRINRCVGDIVSQADGRPVAIVSHGRILTAFYSSLIGRRLTRQEWQSIGLTDLSVLCTKTWMVKSGFFKNLQP
ncbi:histidine phosphatase family protein [Brevibacillus fluminis]|uniref:Histidine phosphatase family protein n=1 Tax=Brevibacillus fluminis TaxID=511487 RepID=A0A3M8DWT4_9BACL|nr:histidine phosphatase family protein [Brevibacillus fluminis]RNB92394.1 histidine phosphatase family protein [Brevibacillus fluminis]